MPELPEVQTVVDSLRPAIVGRVIARVDLRRADILTPQGCDLPSLLTGRTISSIDRRGKKIVFRLEDGCRFYIHLGMTGRLSLERADAPMLPHTHMVISFARKASSDHLRFRDPRRFGGIWWLGCDTEPDERMGPEPLTLRPAQLAMALGRTGRAIKNALLDQSVIAGLGNIYVDESLFHAGIHPLAIASDLTAEQISKLNRSIKATLRKALRHRGSTLRDYVDANGKAGEFQKLHAVYDRTGKNCRKCRAVIERIVLGGRSTHFCPICQCDPDE